MTIKCRNCGGSGTQYGGDSDGSPSVCSVCNGEGKLTGVCSSCHGSGAIFEERPGKLRVMLGTCAKCEGTGKGKDGCFITTATLENKGINDDNCFELQEFRRLRDTYVQQNYPEYVIEYYQVAPKIVESINKLEDSRNQFLEIWNIYLKECLFKATENKLEEATKIYKKMVDDLKLKFITTEDFQNTKFKCLECGSTDPKVCKGGYNNCPYS